jgi:hypothetical protein
MQINHAAVRIFDAFSDHADPAGEGEIKRSPP